MCQILFASSSTGKLKLMERGLAPCGIIVKHISLDIPEIQADTIKEVALQKVLAAYALVKEPVIALDAGFCLDSLGGCPGPYTKYFLERAGIEGLLRLADPTDRKSRFVNCLYYMAPNIKEPVCFEESVVGSVAYKAQGQLRPHHWSPIATIFIPIGYDTTLAGMNNAEFYEWQLARNNGKTLARQFADWYEINRQ